MNSYEKMQRYIDRTRIPNHDRYEMLYWEMCEVYERSAVDLFDALVLAFKYGRAKGYRAAKAERKGTI